MLNSSKMISFLERQKESGLSVKRFCSNECIAPSTFFYWRKKIRKDTIGQRFIPLVVQSPGSAVYPATHKPEGPRVDDNLLEITYPNGTTLRIRQSPDLAGLRSLVSLLD